MATISNDLFLFVCVKHANGGKPNFAEVGKECGIKANAAYMRWNRFKDKLDTSPLNQVASDDENRGTPKKTPKKPSSKKSPSTTPVKGSASKKRKVNEDGDDDEQTTKIKEDD